VDANGQRQRFSSQILPSYMRRAPKVAEVLPILNLRGLSTGDFQTALKLLLGDDATGLSPTTITRLTASWEGEYHGWRQRDLHEVDYVYVWVDGVHFRVRLEEDRLTYDHLMLPCILSLDASVFEGAQGSSGKPSAVHSNIDPSYRRTLYPRYRATK
jgi:hypothetical protein